MVDLATFSDFLGLGQKGTAGTKATGTLRVTNPISGRNDLTIPNGTKFLAPNTLSFFSTEQVLLPAGTLFVAVPIEAQNVGAQYNIPPQNNWSSPQINSVAVESRLPTTGGADAIPERKGFYPQRQTGVGPTDSQLQRALDVSHLVIRDMLGLMDDENLDDDARMTQAVCLLAMWHVENNVIHEVSYGKPSLNATSPTEVRYFRSRVYKPLMSQVSNLINHKTNWKRLINGVEDVA